MGVDISLEAYVFLATVVSGIVSGAIYDIFGVFRFVKKKLFVSLYDIFMSLVICTIIVTVFYLYNSFMLRWYMFIGLFLGVIFYFLCLRRFFVYVLEKILHLFHFIFKILLTPTRFLYKILIVYLFMPVRAFITVPFKKIKGNMSRLKIKRGILKNERKSKKKHKKKKIKNNYSNSHCSSTVYADKRGYASTSDN